MHELDVQRERPWVGKMEVPLVASMETQMVVLLVRWREMGSAESTEWRLVATSAALWGPSTVWNWVESMGYWTVQRTVEPMAVPKAVTTVGQRAIDSESNSAIQTVRMKAATMEPD